MKEEYYFPSADEITQIHVCVWKPEGDPVAILQIAHGMKEYIGRYDEFAEAMNAQGILVIGNDHLGHGKSVSDEFAYGYFSENLGPDDVLADMQTVREKAQEKHPGVPYFLLGHSMGSALTRAYITRHSEGMNGVIIMGTFTAPPVAVALAKRICKMRAAFKGWKYCSKLVDGLAAGGYNKEFKDPKTSVDWLATNEANNIAYENDPYCQHPFTVNAYYGMFEALRQAEKRANINKIDKDLPVLIVSGSEDPVGHHGKDIPKVAKWYRDAGIRSVEEKLYIGDRHEILNEVDREKVYADLKDWILARV